MQVRTARNRHANRAGAGGGSGEPQGSSSTGGGEALLSTGGQHATRVIIEMMFELVLLHEEFESSPSMIPL